MPQAQLIRASGEVVEIQPQHGPTFTLEELQHHVGGYVEKIGIYDGRIMLADEEGLPKCLPTNPKASGIANRFIVGDVVLIPVSQMD